MRERITGAAALAIFGFTLLFTALFVMPELAVNPSQTATPQIVSYVTGQPASAANNGEKGATKINVAPINNFFNGAYNAIRNVGATIAILFAAFAAVMIMMGHRGGVEKLFFVMLGILVLLFIPTIVRSFF